MSIPLFPSLTPNLISAFWRELDPPVDEESEITKMEREEREWKDSIGQSFSNVPPIGKTSNDPEEEFMDDMDDDEETSSDDLDDDDEDEDEDGDEEMPNMFGTNDNLVPPHHSDVGAIASLAAFPDPASSSSARTAARPPQRLLPRPMAARTAARMIASTPDDDSSSSTSSEPSITVTLNRVTASPVIPVTAHNPHSPGVARPARVIVGRHVPAPRPGMPQNSTQPTYIDTAGRPVYSGHVSTGSVSPTSRAYIDAALRSPPGQVNIDDSESDDEISHEAGPPPHAHRGGRSAHAHSPRGCPGPVSENVSRYHQMVAASQILPSASSSRIDNLIESMHQRARAAAAAAASSSVDAILPAASSTSEVLSAATFGSSNGGAMGATSVTASHSEDQDNEVTSTTPDLDSSSSNVAYEM